MKCRTLILTILSFNLPHLVQAQSYEKNGMPCIAGLCVGDGLDEIAMIQWDRPQLATMRGKPVYLDPRRVDDYAIQKSQQIYCGQIRAAAAYLGNGAFDDKAVPVLREVAAACSYKELWGRFTTATGYPTLVQIALVPSADESRMHRWTVVSISQKFPQAKSSVQVADVTRQLQERYGRFPRYPAPHEMARAYLSITPDNFGTGLGVSLARIKPIQEVEQMMMHPLCGGADRISID